MGASLRGTRAFRATRHWPAEGILSDMSVPWRRRVWPWIFVAHAAVVTLLTAAFWVMVWLTPPEAGANIGAGLVAMPLLVPFGLPWSLPALTDPYGFDGLSVPVWTLVFFGPAFLNVALHGAALALAGWWRRRRDRSPLGAGQR
jgi:hypothetical protein